MPELILIVDDEPGILSTLGGILSDEGYATLTTTSGEEALTLYQERRPAVVFLDVWLADRDGLETLQALRKADPAAAVVMMSGHGTTATAVKAIKMGAFDYLEKPLSYRRVVDAAAGALAWKRSQKAGSRKSVPEVPRDRAETERVFSAPPTLPLLADTGRRQRTIQHSTVVYGLGLHSGQRTGMVLQPLPENSGLHFVTLPTGVEIPAHVRAVAETDYATTLSGEGESIRTVEHLLSALHAYGVGNLLIKVHGEIPVLDGSALEFCKILEEVGVAEQDEPQREVVIDKLYKVNGTGEKVLAIEPAERFSVSYLLRYPPPVGEQSCEFTLTSAEDYKREIAPARTFGFMKDLKMLNELGLGSGGRLDNFVLVGEDEVLNTELRFPDEFVRHKILDIVGDLYLLGYPIRGKVTARLTGHRDNIALLRQIVAG
ncbi:MAG: UDP-3-O-[3-hydroxymyristoyl] N-acetylglucosamine deacetylase [Acidobacteriota bacterium]|jgi:UDP-3-O-acyl N-acetylglucosamine deacetylase|nr:UDP-3-O-[3-hydroxymyristoyl] N-acetylglucosamine deacetylase [Acidobacteriota bacterium]